MRHLTIFYCNEALLKKLYSINDYSIEGINSKSDTLYNVVKGFIADGVPVDAIGFQCHFYLGQVPDTLQQNLQRFADLGLDVAITELDINIVGEKNATAFEQQAKDYWTVVNACVQTNRCVSVVCELFSCREVLNIDLSILLTAERLGCIRRPLLDT